MEEQELNDGSVLRWVWLTGRMNDRIAFISLFPIFIFISSMYIDTVDESCLYIIIIIFFFILFPNYLSLIILILLLLWSS